MKKHGNGTVVKKLFTVSAESMNMSIWSPVKGRSADDEKFIDFEALGIKEYEYPSEFIMGDNLKTTLAQLVSGYSSFDSDTIEIGD